MAVDSSTQDPDAIAEHVVSPQTDNAGTEPQMREPSRSCLFTQLPTEIIHDIVSLLRNQDIKQLRLSCKLFARVAVLRIHRVFISANPLNIQVFRAIADHETYRHGVMEIIYDDTYMPRSVFDADVARDPYILCDHRTYENPLSDHEWFDKERRLNIDEINWYNVLMSNHPSSLARVEQAASEMSLEESWTYYQDLVRQQDEVIASDADLRAFQFGLERFSSLKTLIITPAAHGFLFSPLYETPMIRAFPSGFNYCIPRGWPTRRQGDDRGDSFAGRPGPWVGDGKESWHNQIRARWRGCQIAFRALAQNQNVHLSELLIDAHQLESGLNCRLFDQPCDTYQELVSILERPGLRRFHISLHVEDQWDQQWSTFTQGDLFENALAKCADLEHLTLSTNTFAYEGQEWDRFPHLEAILPVHCWPKLQHLRLWNLHVMMAEFLEFLAILPGTLRSLELSCLTFMFQDAGSYEELLSEMRSTLGWQERQVRPHVQIALTYPKLRGGTIAVWIEKEIDEFLYGHGENPFQDIDESQLPYSLPDGVGIIRDAFNPGFERLFEMIKDIDQGFEDDT